MPATLSDTVQFINHVTELEELRLISLALNTRYSTLRMVKSRQFGYNERISFVTKTGVKVYGRITKFNSKTIGVLADNGRSWRVSPVFLTKEVAPA